MKIEQMKDKLELTGSGLRLHFLGTGSAFTKKNYQNNLLVIKNDTHVMIDFGTMASQALMRKGHMVTDIQAFLVTHQHADHIGGMEEVALMGRYFAQKKPDLIIPNFFAKLLWKDSLKGGIAYNEKPHLKLKDVFNLIKAKQILGFDRPVYEIDYKGINFKIFKTNHIPGTAKTLKYAYWSSGVLIDDRILFTADTKFDLDLLEKFNEKFKLDLIIHDCQLFTGGVHASYEELKTLSKPLKNKMLLSHYGDNWEQFHPEEEGFIGFSSPDVYYCFD